jgi:hypothetical protein
MMSEASPEMPSQVAFTASQQETNCQCTVQAGSAHAARICPPILGVQEKVQQLRLDFLESHKLWRKLRKLTPTHDGFPGIRLVLLHSLAHALVRQIVLDCGYNSASLRERLYCRWGSDHGGPMAGILIYTAAPDSEGTLGGLVELGNPASLGRHLQQALDGMRGCASDPVCSEHVPSSDGRGIHAVEQAKLVSVHLFVPQGIVPGIHRRFPVLGMDYKRWGCTCSTSFWIVLVVSASSTSEGWIT